MRKPFTTSAGCALVLASLLSPLLPRSGVAQSADWLDAVRQCWNDADQNTRISCFFTEGKLRGRLSGKECIVEAIKAARSQDQEGAIRWILACRCGDDRPDTKQALRDHRNEAVRYAVDTYGAFVP